MGWLRFIETALLMGKVVIDETLSKQTVDAYRAKYWRVKRMWGDTEAAAIAAVRDGHAHACGPVTWHKERQFLYCTLPSGRRLAYPFPEIETRETPWGARRPCLTHMGVNPFNHQWERQHVYGGLLVENIVQACSRDILANAMFQCELSEDFSPTLSVHDEILAEGPIGASVEDFKKLIEELPMWAQGCPITADAWTGFRYRK
jgi:DNA polymerase